MALEMLTMVPDLLLRMDGMVAWIVFDGIVEIDGHLGFVLHPC